MLPIKYLLIPPIFENDNLKRLLLKLNVTYLLEKIV
jgi:hypothetical protein